MGTPSDVNTDSCFSTAKSRGRLTYRVGLLSQVTVNSKSGGGWSLKCNTPIKNGRMAIRLLKMKMADCNNTIIIILQYGESHTDFLSFFPSLSADFS